MRVDIMPYVYMLDIREIINENDMFVEVSELA